MVINDYAAAAKDEKMSVLAVLSSRFAVNGSGISAEANLLAAFISPSSPAFPKVMGRQTLSN